MLAKQWLNKIRGILDDIESTQMNAIQQAAEVMADSIGKGRWVHTFGCGHATLPIEEMYPRIAGFVYPWLLQQNHRQQPSFLFVWLPVLYRCLHY